MRLLDEYCAGLAALDVPVTRPNDFDTFWQETLALAATTPLNVRGNVLDQPIDAITVHDLQYDGLDGTPINAWFITPRAASPAAPLPVVVIYHGAGGSRGIPQYYLHWICLGCAVVALDFRMQAGLAASHTGFMAGPNMSWFALGLLDKKTYYCYHAWTDALRAIALARSRPECDPRRIAVEGGSQGGAAALLMAAVDPAVALCMADVPSACWWEHRVMQRAGAGSGIASFIRAHPDKLDDVMTTLSYYDNLNHAANIRCPVLISCGLKDPVCPPEGIYAVYNKITAPKQMIAYPFAEHEGGSARHLEPKMRFLRQHFQV
jgi:cephalosporin-C deacetylase